MRAGGLRRGDTGPRVAAVRAQLAAVGPAGQTADHGPAQATGEGAERFDEPLEQAVRAFQQARGLTADGVVGAETARALDAARWRLGDRILRYVPGHLVIGDDVVALQQRLMALGVFSGLVDGVLGPTTEAGLRELQRASGLPADGTCGPATLRALARLDRTVGGGDAAGLRAREAVRRAGTRLTGRVVVLDPGSDGPAAVRVGGAGGAGGGHGWSEAELTHDLATRLEGRLAATGVTAVLTRGSGGAPDLAARIALAEDVRADLYLALRCDAAPTPAASGIACSYWGHDDVRSPVGRRLADLVQRELVRRTGLPDLRTHARAWDVLRLTRMPAVQVDLGYLTSPRDAAVLAQAAFRDTCAEGILAAVQRLYLPEDDDAPTGTLQLGDIIARSSG